MDACRSTSLKLHWGEILCEAFAAYGLRDDGHPPGVARSR
jgi:hypothetical protein